MTEIEILEKALISFTGMSHEAFRLSEKYWQVKTYKKGEFHNDFQQVCKHMGFVLEGVFRTYYVDEKSADEKNIFFYTNNQIVVSYASFINQVPCHYYTQKLLSQSLACLSYRLLIAGLKND